MLIGFTLENWMSFRDRVTFSMVASREEQHLARVPQLDQHGMGVLPISAIYGGNASGKSNFVMALAFAQDLVVKGVPMGKPIRVVPFRLDDSPAMRPSRFCFELLVGETLYEFSFGVTGEAVVEERLTVTDGAKERTLYDRQGDEPNFPEAMAERQKLEYAFHGTQDNQLFLTNSVFQRIDVFRPVYDWFETHLHVINPSSIIRQIDPLMEEGSLRTAMQSALEKLDTGVAGLEGQYIEIDRLGLSPEHLADLEQQVDESHSASMLGVGGGESILVTREEGRLVAKQLMATHHTAAGQEVRFRMAMESDGTRRLIDLLPALFYLSGPGSKSVFVIDEIDRSLHTLLARELLSDFLENCSTETRAQLLLTTHDVQLMDQELFRRDEMWVTEREADGATSIFSFSEFADMHKDKDVRQSYLEGRLGGIPQILAADGLLSPSTTAESGGKG